MHLKIEIWEGEALKSFFGGSIKETLNLIMGHSEKKNSDGGRPTPLSVD